MLELLRKLILDFEELPLETGLPRQLKIETVRGKATICIGVRRSGKSTYMFQVMQGLLDQGVSRQNILYLNFFDDRLHTLKQTGLDIVVEAYFSLYPEKKNTEKVHCFFDEIQTIPGWEPFIDRLMRKLSGIYHRFVRRNAFQRNCYTNAWARPILGDFPFFIQGVPQLQKY
jgi:predicted AAA+ superfamily ATPase